MIRYFSIVLLVAALTNSALADERILSFVSDVTVLENGSLQVVESITVEAEGRNIVRGVYRDLPNSYPHPQYGHYGFKARTPIDVESLSRNGDSEPWHMESVSNGKRVFFGQASRRLKPGIHTYELSYTIHRQIALDQGNAVLYWNVTGNGWQFPIDTARVNVTFPAGSSALNEQAWTGRQGSTESHVKFTSLDSGGAAVATTRRLSAYEGLTVKLGFDSAVMSLPSESTWSKLYKDNTGYAWGIALLLVMPIFYLLMWWFNGRDPELGIVVARYRPIKDLSAAAHRAVYSNLVDDTSFAVGVLSAAIKGHLQIHKQSEGVFKLEPSSDGNKGSLTPSEQLLVNRLFSGVDSVTLGDKYNSRVDSLKDDYEKLLKIKYAKAAHVSHLPTLMIGLLIGGAGLGLIFSSIDGDVLDSLLPLYFLGTSLFILFAGFIKRLRLSSLYFVAVASVAMGVFTLIKGQPQFAIPLLFFGSVFAAFTYLMPAPKPAGQKLINKIAGFRLYLAKAEHESLKRLSLPEKTPQLYEELLPFAIALDLETQWSEQFVTVLANAGKAAAGSNYNSGWYHGSGRFAGANSFAPALAAGLATSVVAASTPPSSSGSSGGGSSGGGGGGGGGGGW